MLSGQQEGPFGILHHPRTVHGTQHQGRRRGPWVASHLLFLGAGVWPCLAQRRDLALRLGLLLDWELGTSIKGRPGSPAPLRGGPIKQGAQACARRCRRTAHASLACPARCRVVRRRACSRHPLADPDSASVIRTRSCLPLKLGCRSSSVGPCHVVHDPKPCSIRCGCRLRLRSFGH